MGAHLVDSVTCLQDCHLGHHDISLLVEGKRSNVTFDGGSIKGEISILVKDGATVNLLGGRIDSRLVADGGTLNVYGDGLNLREARLTGTLRDGTSINVEAETMNGGRIVLYRTPSTPALIAHGLITMIVVGLGVKGLRRRQPANPEDHRRAKNQFTLRELLMCFIVLTCILTFVIHLVRVVQASPP